MSDKAIAEARDQERKIVEALRGLGIECDRFGNSGGCIHDVKTGYKITFGEGWTSAYALLNFLFMTDHLCASTESKPEIHSS